MISWNDCRGWSHSASWRRNHLSMISLICKFHSMGRGINWAYHGRRMLTDNFGLCRRRLNRLLRRLKQNPPLLAEYNFVIRDQLNRAIVEVVNNPLSDKGNRVLYLPHHGVVRQDMTTSRLRTVYDISAKMWILIKWLLVHPSTILLSLSSTCRRHGEDLADGLSAGKGSWFAQIPVDSWVECSCTCDNQSCSPICRILILSR